MSSEKKATGGVSDVGAWAMNVVSSVGIIMANKAVLSVYNFKFATSLTGLHFVMTAVVGLSCVAFGYLPGKPVPAWDLIWFSGVANASIVGMNLNLMYNSVGFYQISKLAMIPTVCLLEFLMHGKTFSREVLASVVTVLLGVGVCTVTDVSVSFAGALCAFVAIIATSLQQITIGSLQKKHNIGSFDLLSKTAPVQAASLIVLGPFFDYFFSNRNILEYQLSGGALGFILLSCLLAVFCNLSQFICIGRFSAVSFQVLGHMKTVLVLVLGWVLFDAQLTLKNLGGMAMAVIGMILYSWAVEKNKAQAQALEKSKSLEVETTSLLKEDLEKSDDK